MSKSDFQKWWTKYGIPVTGKDITPDDRYWLKMGVTILHLTPSTAVGMLLAMVFDEKRDRARKGLDSLRAQYKKSHPTLALHWGRKPAGRNHLLQEKDSVDIALANELGVGKTVILKSSGLAPDNFEASSNASKYDLLNRSINRGKTSLSFRAEKDKLYMLPPTRRRQEILSRLQRIKQSFPS